MIIKILSNLHQKVSLSTTLQLLDGVGLCNKYLEKLSVIENSITSILTKQWHGRFHFPRYLVNNDYKNTFQSTSVGEFINYTVMA
jgi:hypothetical protein